MDESRKPLPYLPRRMPRGYFIVGGESFLINVNIGSGVIVYDDFPNYKEFSVKDQLDSLKEDLLQVEFNKGYLIDVGWYPSFDKKGHFIVYLIKNSNWEKPLFEKKTKSINVARETIEEYALLIDSKL